MSLEQQTPGQQTVLFPDVEPSRRRGRTAAGLRGFARFGLPPLLVLAAFIGLWYLITYEVLDPNRRFLLPPPQDVVNIGLRDEANLTEVLNGLWATTQVALTGLAISMILGVGLAIFMSQAKWIERSFYPYAVVLQTVPV